MLPTVDDLKTVALPDFPDEGSELVVMEGESVVPLRIARAFAIKADPGVQRGDHAHRRCSQFLVCLNGVMAVECDDGVRSVSFRLDLPHQALLVPPGIWLKLESQVEQTVLLVLCDRPFEPEDYVRDRSEFEAWRRNP